MRSILLATDGGVPARGDLRLLRRPIVDRAEGETDERESPQSAGGRHVDYALIRLDRKVTGRAVLKVAAKEELFLGKQLFVIGHPSGLPTKLADHASTNQVRATTFRSNLDIFEGNSGSPILSARSNAIVGVLDGGNKDYVWQGKCRVVNALPNGKGREVATRASALDLSGLK